MPTTVLYRKNGGEVLKISLKGQLFDDRNTTYWGRLIDPPFPDGIAIRQDMGDGTLGPLRVLGYAKIYDLTNVRNATQVEIDNFAVAEATDEALQDAERAAVLLTVNPQLRKAFKAIVKRVLFLTNAQATQWNALRTQIAACTNVATLKTLVAANTQNLSTYTLAQAITALLNDIDPGD